MQYVFDSNEKYLSQLPSLNLIAPEQMAIVFSKVYTHTN